MAAEHDLEELQVEPLGMRADLVEVEPRLEVEIVGAGAVLEVEIDEAGRVRILRRRLAQEHRGLDRERRRADAAGGATRKEMIWLPSSGRLEVAFSARMQALQHLLRLDRLAQEIGDADLEEPAHERVVEGVGERRSPGARPKRRMVMPWRAIRLSRRFGVDVDDDDRGGVDLGALARPARRSPAMTVTDGRMDAPAAPATALRKRRVRSDEHDRRRLRGGVVHLVVLRAKTRCVSVRGGRGARHPHRDRHDRRARPPPPSRRPRRLVALDRVDDAPAAHRDVGPREPRRPGIDRVDGAVPGDRVAGMRRDGLAALDVVGAGSGRAGRRARRRRGAGRASDQ